jgi:hypothetical protein
MKVCYYSFSKKLCQSMTEGGISCYSTTTIIIRLDEAQDFWDLSLDETDLRGGLKRFDISMIDRDQERGTDAHCKFKGRGCQY